MFAFQTVAEQGNENNTTVASHFSVLLSALLSTTTTLSLLWHEGGLCGGGQAGQSLSSGQGAAWLQGGLFLSFKRCPAHLWEGAHHGQAPVPIKTCSFPLEVLPSPTPHLEPSLTDLGFCQNCFQDCYGAEVLVQVHLKVVPRSCLHVCIVVVDMCWSTGRPVPGSALCVWSREHSAVQGDLLSQQLFPGHAGSSQDCFAVASDACLFPGLVFR